MSPDAPFPPEVIQLAADMLTGAWKAVAYPGDSTASDNQADARDIVVAYRKRRIERALGQVDALLQYDDAKAIMMAKSNPQP